MATLGSGQRRAVAAVSLMIASSMALPMATAHAGPSVATAKKQLDQLNKQVDGLVQAYDKAQSTLGASQKKLTAATNAAKGEQAIYDKLHNVVAQMAASAYKSGDVTPEVLSARDPLVALDQMSLLTAITKDRGSQLSQFFQSAQRLQFAHGQAQQALADVNQTLSSLRSQKATLDKQIAQQEKLIVAAGGTIYANSPQPQTYMGSATGKALIALQFAFRQLGKAYVYGATGPDYYDCSGLTMRAWEAAGVSLPRTSEAQAYAFSPQIAYKNLQPGDLVLFYSALHHIGMYVGGGQMIQAPHTGANVEISSMGPGSSYYSLFQWGVRPS
ncbi:MAG TPA: NlpC/P60 family protein [Streptosporangiaceae bacterium]|nr:NlpC/P60 family protein [Streptosporangiaceae bacterium]